jgi:transcriptional regulator with XRE-family HTH domain
MSWEQLALEVRKRRKELGLTQPDVVARGGPSVETLRMVENNRAGRLRPRSRRNLEQVLQWESGSIDAILAGGVPTPEQEKPSEPPESDRFWAARQVVSLKATFSRIREGMAGDAQEALLAEITRSAKEAEEAIVTVLPWLDDVERGVAIQLLVDLRAPIA